MPDDADAVHDAANWLAAKGQWSRATALHAIADRIQQRQAWGACADCGLPYSDDGWCDAVVPDEVWNDRIGPHGDGSGLLCFNCMTRRAVRLGMTNVPLSINSGPWRVIVHDSAPRRSYVSLPPGGPNA